MPRHDAGHETSSKTSSQPSDTQVSGDQINHPAHYNQHGIECIDAIEMLELGFHLGNVLKYLWRWKDKDGLTALKKARWYLDRYISLMEGANGKEKNSRSR